MKAGEALRKNLTTPSPVIWDTEMVAQFFGVSVRTVNGWTTKGWVTMHRPSGPSRGNMPDPISPARTS